MAHSIEQILVEGLLATAPEEIQAQSYQLISDLKAILKKHPRKVAALAMMKVYMDMGEEIRKDLVRDVK